MSKRENEVSVARFLVTEASYNPITVMDLAATMPGVKNRGVISVIEISQDDYIIGKRLETENLYLQKLKTFKPIIA